MLSQPASTDTSLPLIAATHLSEIYEEPLQNTTHHQVVPSETIKPFRYKKFNEWAQTANSSVFSRLRQELRAENPQNMEYEGN